jgi:hypothetical protein
MPRFIAWFGIAYVAVIVLGVIGWVMNITTIVSHINDPVTGMTVLRAVGIFLFPLGAVLGYF